MNHNEYDLSELPETAIALVTFKRDGETMFGVAFHDHAENRVVVRTDNDYHFFPLFGRTLTILDTLDQSFLATLKEGQSLLVCTSHTAHIGTVRFIDDTVIRVSYANGLNAQFDRHGISISAALWLRPLSDATQGNHALIDSIIQAANILKRQNPRLSMQQIVDLRHALATIEACKDVEQTAWCS